MINFKNEDHSSEWSQIFADALERYANCVQAVAERIPGLDDWPTALKMTNRLIDDADFSFMEKHSEEYSGD